jgi:hypothetical protein
MGSESSPHLYATTIKTQRVDLVSGASGHVGDLTFQDRGQYAVSRTGRFVAFVSGSQLVSAATASSDVYLKDRATGQLALLTGKFDGSSTMSFWTLSMDGNATWLVFSVSDRTSSPVYEQFYVANLRTGVFTAIDGGSPASAVHPTEEGSVNAAGTEVVYTGGGVSLVQQPTDAPALQGTAWYVRDLRSGVIHRVAAATPTSQLTKCQGSKAEYAPLLSADGKYLIDVNGMQLASSDTDCGLDIYEAAVG